MENSNAKAIRPLRLIKTASIILLIFVFLIYFLPSDFTGSFFTDKVTDEAVFLVDPFNSACFCVLTDFCGGKWLIVTIPPQPDFDPNDLCWFPPNIVINGLYINETQVTPPNAYWQLFWQWTGWFNFTGNLLGILPLGTPDIDFNNASFRLNLNVNGENHVFIDQYSLNNGYYSTIGIYGGFDSDPNADDFTGYNDFGEFYSNYGALGNFQSQSLMTANASFSGDGSEGDEQEQEPEPAPITYIDLSTLDSADGITGLTGIGGFDNIGGFFGFTPIPPEAEDEEEDKDDTGEEDKEDKEDEDPEDDITGDGDDISDGGDPGDGDDISDGGGPGDGDDNTGDGTQPPAPTGNPPEGDGDGTQPPVYADGFEDKAGTMEEGKYADIVVWDRNPFTIDPSEIRDCKAVCTVFNGRIVFEA